MQKLKKTEILSNFYTKKNAKKNLQLKILI